MYKSISSQRLLNYLTIVFLLIAPVTFAQESATPDSDVSGIKKTVNTTHTGILQAPRAGVYKYDPNATRWMSNLANFEIEHEGPDPDLYYKIKAEKKAIKQYHPANPKHFSPGRSKRTEDPNISRNFLGNEMANGTPPDNTMAISNGGIIVSVDNNSIAYFDEDGTLLFSEVHFDFFSSLSGLVNDFFDPKVLYDAEADRFIYLILHGSGPNNSKVLVATSQTNDPQDGWWLYDLTGNPLDDNSWLDYPHIGYSENEIFITGNLFYGGAGFNQSVIYQIEKDPIYAGNTMNYQVWSNILDGLDDPPFNIVPAPPGQDGGFQAGIYLVSNVNNGGKWVHLYELTNDMGNNPQLDVIALETPERYEVPADGAQKGAAAGMDNGDCRVQSAFYLNDIVHLVFSSDYDNSGYSSIIYGRVNVTDQSLAISTVGSNSYDYAFPSVASFSASAEDQSVIIGFLATGASIFPETRVINCDHHMNWSNSVLVKDGEGFVDLMFGPNERWGDYSGISRRHNEEKPTIWFTGCYGTDQNRYSAWIAEIQGTGSGPNAAFTQNITSGNAPLTVTFTNQSTNATSYQWDMGDGSITSQENPTWVFPTKGTYHVFLTAYNNYGSAVADEFILVEVMPGIDEAADGRGSVKVFPNPVADLFYLEFDLEERTMLDISIVDVQGKLVKNLYKASVKSGRNQLSFNKNALPAGVYYVVIASENQTIKHEKIVIMD